MTATEPQRRIRRTLRCERERGRAEVLAEVGRERAAMLNGMVRLKFGSKVVAEISGVVENADRELAESLVAALMNSDSPDEFLAAVR